MHGVIIVGSSRSENGSDLTECLDGTVTNRTSQQVIVGIPEMKRVPTARVMAIENEHESGLFENMFQRYMVSRSVCLYPQNNTRGASSGTSR